MNDETRDMKSGRAIRLADAPHDGALRIVEIQGGEAVRRRLFSLGFHKGVLVRLEGRAILRGPLLVLNVTADCRIALGRGVAQKILVEAVHDAS
jgi:Fe2+ transport system protein FeoA